MGRNFPRKNLEKRICSKLGLFQTPGAEHWDLQRPSGISLLSETRELLNPIPPARIPASSQDISGTSKHFSHFSMTTTLQPSNPKQEEPRTGGIQPFLPGYPKNPRHHELLATPAPKRNGIFFFVASQKSYGCNRPSLDLRINRSSFVPQGPSQQLEKPPAQMFPVRPGMVIPEKCCSSKDKHPILLSQPESLTQGKAPESKDSHGNASCLTA